MLQEQHLIPFYLHALPGMIAEIIKLIPISFIIPIFFIFFNKKTTSRQALDSDLYDDKE